MRISDWSSDVCSSDLASAPRPCRVSPIEGVAAALVLVNVALVALRSVWNYPFALLAVTLYAFVFFEAKLYSDMLLQGFFFALNLYGWAAWPRARGASGVPGGRSEERRVGKEGVSTCRSRWSRALSKKK